VIIHYKTCYDNQFMLAAMIANARIMALFRFGWFAMVRTTSGKKCKWNCTLPKKDHLYHNVLSSLPIHW